MKTYLYPAKKTWDLISKRPYIGNRDLDITVREIIARVRSEGDKALHEYSEQFDGAIIKELKVSDAEIKESVKAVSDKLKKAIKTAGENIDKFHRSQIPEEAVVETMPGIKCWRKNVPVERVGLYIPGGSASLFSTVLMLAIPAKIAGCREVIICTPPDKNGRIDPLMIYSAMMTGVTSFYKIGGAQAIAAMAYGTETIPRVYKILGPGNQYVTKAKEIVQADGIAIDMPAGPSEVLVIADKNADPEFVAADLLAQAEHGTDSQVVFLTDNKKMLIRVNRVVDEQLQRLPRKNIASAALENSFSLLLSSVMECIDFSNVYAPEHLIINTSDASALAEKVINAGSVFIGKYSCESAGDYASGTNHTLPTNGFARSFSGVSVDSFVKKVTFQKLSHKGIERLGPAIKIMAEAENLHGHKNAVSVRLKR